MDLWSLPHFWLFLWSCDPIYIAFALHRFFTMNTKVQIPGYTTNQGHSPSLLPLAWGIRLLAATPNGTSLKQPPPSLSPNSPPNSHGNLEA